MFLARTQSQDVLGVFNTLIVNSTRLYSSLGPEPLVVLSVWLFVCSASLCECNSCDVVGLHILQVDWSWCVIDHYNPYPGVKGVLLTGEYKHKVICYIFFLNHYHLNYTVNLLKTKIYWTVQLIDFFSSHIYSYIIYLLWQIISEFWHYFPISCPLGLYVKYLYQMWICAEGVSFR
jgi:hypothetical protein